MSKFAKTKFLLCRVVGVFPSRGSTFFLARQCFGAFTDALIGGGVCKNFYTFLVVFSPVLSPNHLHLFCILPCIKVVGKMWKMRSWSIKGVDLGVKMPVKREKPFFRMSAENGQKGVRNRGLGRRNGQSRRRNSVFRASWRIVTQYWYSTHYAKISIFCTKNLCISFAFANRFANPYMIDYQIVSILILCFCIFACKKCMGGRRVYIYIYI